MLQHCKFIYIYTLLKLNQKYIIKKLMYDLKKNLVSKKLSSNINYTKNLKIFLFMIQ